MIFVHRCRGCTHQQQEHLQSACSNGYCQCSMRNFMRGPSESLTTYDSNDGTHPEILMVTPPGSMWRAGG
jgi:hypothetical protein